ncbi:MAG TPA: hypothetical protein VF179_09950 [Thermoanaerobaculia bacterium]|nr:hypothetical protein [Thermoanaerobaculia bacterium]
MPSVARQEAAKETGGSAWKAPPLGSFLSTFGGSRYTAGMENSRLDSEVRRLAELLDRVVRLSKRSRRSLESDLGLGSSGLSKVLNGTVRLQFSHVLSILEAIQVDPYDFFRSAYPERRWKKNPIVEQLHIPGEQEGQLAEDDLSDFDERVRQVLLRLLGEKAQGAN